MRAPSYLSAAFLAAAVGAAAAQPLPWPPTADPGAKVAASGEGKKVSFAGYTWTARDSGGAGVLPGPNVFSSSSDAVWTDAWGLHLSLAPTDGCTKWAASEVTLDAPLKYGTYLFRIVGPIDTLDPDAVFGAFVWDDDSTAAQGFNEFDVEIARWGQPSQVDGTAAQFALQPLRPDKVPGWRMRFLANSMAKAAPPPASVRATDAACATGAAASAPPPQVSQLTCALSWFEGELSFACFDGLFTLETVGAAGEGRLVAAYTYANAEHVPVQPPEGAGPRFHFNLWQLDMSRAPSGGRRVEFTIAGFEHSAARVPLGVPANAKLIPVS